MTNNSHPERSEGSNISHPEALAEGSKVKEILHPEGFRMTEN